MKVKTNSNFSVPAEAFAVSASENGYTLQYSADGYTFTNYTAATPSDEVLFVVGLPKNCTYKLNSSANEELFIQY